MLPVILMVYFRGLRFFACFDIYYFIISGGNMKGFPFIYNMARGANMPDQIAKLLFRFLNKMMVPYKMQSHNA